MPSRLQAQLNGFGAHFYDELIMIFILVNNFPIDLIVSKVTPNLYTLLGYKMFPMFAIINIGAVVFSFVSTIFPPFVIIIGIFPKPKS